MDGIQDCLLAKLLVCFHCVSVRAVDEEAFFCLPEGIFNSFPISWVEQPNDSFFLAVLLGTDVAVHDNYVIMVADAWACGTARGEFRGRCKVQL